MSCSPPSSGVFNGGTITGVLTIATTDPSGDDMLILDAPTGYHQGAGNGWMFRALSGDGTEILTFDPSAALGLTSAVEEATAAQLTLANGNVAGGTTNLRSVASTGTADRLTIATSGAKIFAVTVAGAYLTACHVAPVDAALSAGECAVWFDQTNGAGNTKLMAKGKSADGTVKTATIAVLA